MKMCSQCGTEKSASEFYADKRAKDGLHSECKACHKKQYDVRATKPDVSAIKAAVEAAGVRTCTVCDKIKSLDEFYKNSKRPSGYCSECKQCNKEYIREWRQRPENKAKELARSRSKERIEYRNGREESPPGRALAMVTAARNNGKNHGRSFTCDLDPADIQAALERGVCEVTGIPFDLTRGDGKKAFGPSLDRINPRKGYVKGNVQVVVWCYNAARGFWGDEVLETLVHTLCKREHAETLVRVPAGTLLSEQLSPQDS